MRPFWGWKRALEDAGLSYSKINIELRNYVDCEICGRDFGALVGHLIAGHQITTEDYRLAYPDAEMTCETVRAVLSVPRKGECTTLPRWEPIWTPEYILDRMAELRRRKFPLNPGWAADHERSLNAMAIEYFGSWQEALRRIGLNPKTAPEAQPAWEYRSPWWRADKTAIIAEIRRRNAAGEPISSSKIVRTKFGPAFLERVRKLFGTWDCALVAAGLDSQHSPWRYANKTAIVAEIRRRKRAGESLHFKKAGRKKWEKSLRKRSRKLFGSWSAALRAAGIDPAYEKSPWPTANKGAVVAEIRRRQRAGKSLGTTDLEHEKWGQALLKRARTLFGSWRTAILAADVDPPLHLVTEWPTANKAAVLNEIRRRQRAGEPLLYRQTERTASGVPLVRRAIRLFGSWDAALADAGVDVFAP